MVVSFAAGGPTDMVARLIAGPMGRSLGVNVVVENVTGAAGSVGVGRVAHSAPDGYTLSIGHWSTHVDKKAKMNQSNFFPVRPSKPVFRNQTRHSDLAKVAG
ncbi:MAG: tripartite tricarboxylate transporter substrate-binding protein [Xanthobacteraceae bacterium]